MSQGRHRAPRTPAPARKISLRRLAAAAGFAAAAATGIGLADGAVTSATPADTGWGAPDTTTVVDSDTGTDSGGTAVYLDDTGWG
ncbi:hypothetical protein [Streptomyces cylindrosporus]|uniref:Uncharacterized protein n=1 Tax=Streptomyces cylindrosporus TaxID=2927583 RepID=A0ABS9YR26_9ACTN|nr:hypothetical protein [Streptomyces cylindrosporus]MCI3279145.1 hypothetical protein [Streptomyces cylindrosporus]